MTKLLFEGAKIPIASKDELSVVTRLGENISFTDEDRHVTAYLFHGHVYVIKIEPLGPRE